MGPLGDQIVRGEMAAPTGRSKDRTRMDEDEVSSSRLNFCNGASMILVVFQYLLKWWNVVLQFLALVPLLVLVRKTNRTVHWLLLYRSLFGNYLDLSFSNLFLQDHVESRLSKNIIKQARLQVRYFINLMWRRRRAYPSFEWTMRFKWHRRLRWRRSWGLGRRDLTLWGTVGDLTPDFVTASLLACSFGRAFEISYMPYNMALFTGVVQKTLLVILH